MGDLRPNNGGETPPEDGGGARPGDLSGFPSEWGAIVIPDDASELDAEADALRREMRREHRRSRVRSILGLPSGDVDGPSLGVPIVVMAVAIITTLLSLFVVTWDRNRLTTAPPGEGRETAAPASLSDISLADAGGDRVRLGNLTPAVVLLADGCDCAELIAALGAAAPAAVTIVPIGRTAPCAVGTAANVRCLTDPDGVVTSRWPAANGASGSSTGGPSVAPGATVTAPASHRATAVLVDSAGTATAPVLIDSADDLAAGLTKLA